MVTMKLTTETCQYNLVLATSCNGLFVVWTVFQVLGRHGGALASQHRSVNLASMESSGPGCL
eukprot:5602039-Amphidinium_carterae.1